MKFYELRTTIDTQGDLVSFRGDKSGRYTSYFVWNEGDGKFLSFIKPKAFAQEFLTPQLIAQTDFLEDDLGIPIFSIKAADIFKKTIPEEVEFYPLTIDAHGTDVEFSICKVRNYLPLVDESNSSFRTMQDGSSLITRRVYYSNSTQDFHIARDHKHNDCLVSEAFVELCFKNNLKIGFSELQQSSSSPKFK